MLIRVTTLLLALALSRPALAAITAEDLFRADVIVEVDIRMSPDDWNALRTQTRPIVEAIAATPMESPFTYFEADVTINGVEIAGVGVRKKGFVGSLSDERPSLKIHLSKFRDDDPPVEGLDRVTLNNNQQDRTLASQYLGYRIFREAGVPACRCNLAHVTVNGESLGVYSHVESVRKPMLVDRFGKGGGALFEGTVADFYPGLTARFEGKKKNSDFAPLDAIAELLEAEQPDLAALNEIIDLRAFVRYWAIESLIGFWDGYAQNQNNYFLYRNPANERFYFLPWGLDSAFETRMPIAPFEITYKSLHHRGRLANRLAANEAARAVYIETLRELLVDHWREDELLAELDRIEALAAPHLHESQRDHARAVDRMRSFIRKRRAVIESELESWPYDLDPPHRPSYFEEIGTLTASIAGNWAERPAIVPAGVGTVTDAVHTYDGEQVALRDFGVFVGPNPNPGSWDLSGPAVLVYARREDNGERVMFAFGLPTQGFGDGDDQPVLEAAYIRGEMEGPNANPRLDAMVGTARVEADGSAVGDEMRGEVSLRIMRWNAAPMADVGEKADLPYPDDSLWSAAAAGDVDAVREQLQDEVDIEAGDPAFGITPLSIAVLHDQPAVVSLLIEGGADVNGRGRDGGTPMFGAAFLGRSACAELLLAAGADITLRNVRGESIRDTLVMDYGAVEFIQTLLNYEVERDAVMSGRKAIAAQLREAAGEEPGR